MWYQCYHSTKYPVVTFVHIDNPEMTEDSVRNLSIHGNPNANSTMIDFTQNHNEDLFRHTSINSSERNLNKSLSQPPQDCQSVECSSYNVGHLSHIPRIPPSPATYNIPAYKKNSIATQKDEEDIFGMIKLGDSDVCYTSGTIEWVGRKRSFPINSGFKTISGNKDIPEPFSKKVKLNRTFTNEVNKIKECDCADVLPTVNAIVDHLNALHEAVDLVDLRINTLEDVITRKN